MTFVWFKHPIFRSSKFYIPHRFAYGNAEIANVCKLIQKNVDNVLYKYFVFKVGNKFRFLPDFLQLVQS